MNIHLSYVVFSGGSLLQTVYSSVPHNLSIKYFPTHNIPNQLMNRILITLLLLGTIHFLPAAAAQSEQPNIIVFLVDDMGWADIGANGSKFHETPSIDRFAANKDAKLTLEELKKTK